MTSNENSVGSSALTICVAEARERDTIYRVRHEVNARELGQHHTNSSGSLQDSLDERNIYIVAKTQNDLVRVSEHHAAETRPHIR